MRRTLLLVLSGALLLGHPDAAFAQNDAPEPDLASEERDRIEYERDMARDRFEVSETSLKVLAKRRIEASRRGAAVRRSEFVAGRQTLDVLREAETALLAAQAWPPLAPPPGIDLEARWRFAHEVAYHNQTRYEAARINAADYYMSLYLLRDAEVALALTRPKAKGPDPEGSR